MASREEELWKAIKEGRLVDAKNLIASGADTRLPNHNDNELTALDYAQLTGDINFFKYVSYKNREINVKTVTERFPSLVETFLTLPDFQMNFKWRVYSWVPFISAFCPKDEWKLTKVGGKLRIDTSLANWSGFRFTKGSISVFFDASTENMLDSFIAIDNVSGERISVLREMVTPEEENQNIENNNNNNNGEDETPISSFDNDINNLMKMDLLKGTILVDNIQRKEVLSGVFHKKPKTIIHDNLFHATEYELEDIKVRFMQYYFEDFGKDEIFKYENGNEFKKVDKKKKEKRHKSKKGDKKKHENPEKEEKYQSDSENINDDDFDNGNTNNNRNINSNNTNNDNNNNKDPFKDYNLNDANDNNDDEGKNHNKKHSIKPKFYEKTYSGKFWCARDFPVQVWTLYPFLEALAPFKETPCNVIKVLDFFDVGTPVKAEISVFPTVKVEFQFCNYNGNVDEYRDYVNQPLSSESAQ